jgi:hypothetical protein
MVCQSDPETVGETDPFLKMLRESDADGKQALGNLAELQVGIGQFIGAGVNESYV